MHRSLAELYDALSISSELAGIRQIISDEVRGKHSLIEESLDQLIKSNGKLLRPALVLISSRFGKSNGSVPRLAAAVELLHMATLVHDDIIDRSPTRRGKATLNALYGDRKAVLLGDYLFSRSFSLAARHTDIDTGNYIARIVGSICESEIRQNEGQFDLSIGYREYHRRIMGKTAALFAVSMYLGAVESDLDERNTARLKKIGYNLGAAFQIIDDILDCSLASDATGKLAGTDIREGVVNLPQLCALERDDGTLRSLLAAGKRGKGSGRLRRGRVKRILQLIHEFDGVKMAEDIAAGYMKKAQQSIELLPQVPARGQLDELSRFLLSRTY